MGRRFDLSGLETSIGRDNTNSIVLLDPKVSRRHAKVLLRDQITYLVDLDSSLGTFHNGNRITAPVQLRTGDIIQVGDTPFGYEEHAATQTSSQSMQTPVTPTRVAPPPPTVAPAFVAPLAPQGQAAMVNPDSHAPSQFACPVCLNPMVQRLATVVRSGMTSGTFAAGMGMIGDAGLNVGGLAGVAHNATHLAKLLAPPKEPKLITNTLPLIAILLGGMVAFCGFVGLVGRLDPLSIAIVSIVLGSGILLIGLFTYKGARQNDLTRFNQAHVRWQQAMTAYDRLFFCDRCDHVYDYQTRQVRRPESAYDLI